MTGMFITRIRCIQVLLLLSTIVPLHSAVTKQFMTSITEEIHNGILFKHIVDVDNGIKKESFFMAGRPLNSSEYEEALLNAEKEASKRERKKVQEEKLKIYETQYKGRVKVTQIDLKQAVTALENELSKLADERLKPFMTYNLDTVGSAEHLKNIQEKFIPEAKKLSEAPPEGLDIKKIQEAAADLRNLTTRVKETFIIAVNTGINKADDTKLLKELLALL